MNGSSAISSDRNKTLSTITYSTGIQPKTINPEWNEHFEL
jgi:hypothetical protein